MSKDGFDADDIASTFARFANKRRNIVCDESKLQRKKPEPIALSSATSSLGSAVLSGLVSGISGSSKQMDDNEYKSPIKYSWQRKDFFE